MPQAPDEVLDDAHIEFHDPGYVGDITADILGEDSRMPSTPAPLPSMASVPTFTSVGHPAATAAAASLASGGPCATRQTDAATALEDGPSSMQHGRRSHASALEGSEENLEPPAKQLRAHTTWFTDCNCEDSDEGWDGSETCTSLGTSWSHHCLSITDWGAEVDHHDAFTATRVSPQEETQMTRKDQKAINKEIPWQVIIRRSPELINRFVTAVKKEFTAWETWNVIEPVTEKEAARILTDASLKRRVLRSRAAYRDKSSGQVPTDADGISIDLNDLAPKCRVVILGHQDPDARILERHAPVALRCTLHFALQLLATGLPHNWHAVGADIATAFLQGSVSQKRPDTLYMLAPQDPIIRESGCFRHRLYRIVGNAYGLPDAPAVFGQKARECFLQTGAVIHPLDTCCFMWRCKQRQPPHNLMALAVVHVDDMLLVHHPEFEQLALVRSAFAWGSWTSYSAQRPGTLMFLGKELQIEANGVLLHQQTFTRETKVAAATTRGRPEEVLEGSALTEFRSLVGCLQWLSGGSRADLSASTSLLQSGNPTRAQLRGLQQTVQFAQQTSSTGARFYPIPLQDIILVGYADASFNNADGHKSQLGMVIVAAHRDILRPGTEADVSLIDWKSHRSRRVTRSTLSAESIALDATIDHVQFLAALWGIALYDKERRDPSGYVGWTVCTDCRSLYDAVTQANTVTEEKRVLIDVCAMREALQEGAQHHAYLDAKPRWVPTTHQHADALTKLDRNLRDRFNTWLQKPRIRLSSLSGQAFMTCTARTWSRLDRGATCYRTTAKQGPCWSTVVHRRTRDADSQAILEDSDVMNITPDKLHGPLPPPVPRNIVTELTYQQWLPNTL
eukprot:6491962-Amphidinium_carterae.1